jgi:hypothetical protein
MIPFFFVFSFSLIIKFIEIFIMLKKWGQDPVELNYIPIIF